MRTPKNMTKTGYVLYAFSDKRDIRRIYKDVNGILWIKYDGQWQTVLDTEWLCQKRRIFCVRLPG